MKELFKFGVVEDLKTIFFFIQLSYRLQKSYLMLICSNTLLKATVPFINVIIPRYLIDELVGGKNRDRILLYIGILVISNGIIYIITQVLDEVMIVENERFNNKVEQYIGGKIMDAKYQLLEDAATLDLIDKALFPVQKLGSIPLMIGGFTNIVSNTIVVLGMLSIILSYSKFLIGYLLLSCLLSLICHGKLKKLSVLTNQIVIPINRKFTYYIRNITDYTRAKDYKIYALKELIINKIKEYNKESYSKIYELGKKNSIYNSVNQVNLSLQILVTYMYSIYSFIQGNISIALFTMYINTIIQVSSGINQIIYEYVLFGQNCDYLREFIKLEDLLQVHTSPARLELNEIESIEFKNVSFRYSKHSNYVLKKVSFRMDKGNNIAIVGMNGSGKTTIIKLLLRLYDIEEGEIMINDINIREYEEASYSKRFGVLFQDFKLFSMSIKDNITIGDNSQGGDEKVNEYVHELIQRVGLDERLSRDMYDAILYKRFDNDGLELSGGQIQKLAIARMLYKKSPVMIMDEPTSALDPKAEADIFELFHDIVREGKDKIALFISHRLSSCIFCDRILVLKDGMVVQNGTHIELKNMNGLYKDMWDKQASFYVE